VKRQTDPVALRPSPFDQHAIVYFKRRPENDTAESIPGRDFLASCPDKVRALISRVLIAVAEAPPHRFSGGGYWEAMHGEMTGWYEVRVDGAQKKRHYRLFCRLDYAAEGRDKPLLVVVTGLAKPLGRTLSEKEYLRVRELGEEYLSANPRSLA
jgi:hypothetical protein